ELDVEIVGGFGELVDRRDAGVEKAFALGEPHAGDEEQVAVCGDLELARGAAAIERVAGVSPLDGGGRGETIRDDLTEPGEAQAIDGEDVVDGVRGAAAVAEDEFDGRVGADADRVELVDVGGELEQRRDLRASCELG